MESNRKEHENMKGLILIGGKSSRMGTDKSELSYHGISQKEYLRNLLEHKGIETYYSVSNSSSVISTKVEKSKKSRFIVDNSPDLGPIAGICSAFQNDPNSAWLVLAVDLPFIDKQLIDLLVDKRDKSKFATSVKGISKLAPEPLISIYEPKAYSIILNYIAMGTLSPKKILMESDIETLQVDDSIIRNVNTPEEFREAKNHLR